MQAKKAHVQALKVCVRVKNAGVQARKAESQVQNAGVQAKNARVRVEKARQVVLLHRTRCIAVRALRSQTQIRER